MNIPLRIEEVVPCKSLLPFIRRWVFLEYTGEEEFLYKIAPSGTIVITHLNGIHPTVYKGDRIIEYPTTTYFVGHPIEEDVSIVFRPGVKQVVCEFSYTGLHRLLHIPVDELIDVEPPIGLFGHQELVDLLEGIKENDEIKNRIEMYLLARVPKAKAVDKETQELIEKIQKTYSTRSPLFREKDQADRKRIYRKFKKQTGLSPKQFRRIYQMNMVIKLINEEDFDTLTELALKSGYYDQSSFIKHIRHHMNQSPSWLINNKEELLFQYMGGPKDD